MPWPEEQQDRLTQFIRFCLVGSSGVVVNTAVLILLHARLHLPLVMASALAVEAAILNNFFWNNLWTFGQRQVSLVRLLKFNAVSLFGLVLTTAMLLLLVHGFGMHYVFANLLAIGTVSIWNFLANARWTWQPD